MEHKQHDINYYRRTAQTALRRNMLDLVRDLIDIIAWYNGVDAEKIYDRIKSTLEDQFPNKGN